MMNKTLIDPLIAQNPVTLNVLGICSALAITNALEPAIIMGASMTGVLIFSNVSISLMRNIIPASVRIIIEMTIIATGVIIIDQLLKAFVPDVAKTLSVFVGLIVTNCIVLGRAEAFAVKNRPWPSCMDAIGNGLGYTLILVIVASIRELFGSGSLLGFEILPLIKSGGWYAPNQMMLLPPSAFFIIAGLIWFIRSLRTEQVETREFSEIEVRNLELEQ
jgi:Na+-transporting NADH:ubiquinone oxidoreductase subunit D